MVAMFALAMFATGCSEDDGYNADTAVSYFKPFCAIFRRLDCQYHCCHVLTPPWERI